MLLTRRAPDHIARPNFLFRATLALHPPTSGCDDQGLPERMRVPCCPSAGLERDTDGEHACRSCRLGQRVNSYSAGKVLSRSFAGRLRTTLFDIHFLNSLSDGVRTLSPVLKRLRIYFS